jgi:hypothetical protein
LGAPWAICFTPGQHQYLYSSNSNSNSNPPDSMDNGEIYLQDGAGRKNTWQIRRGRQAAEGVFGAVNELDCRNPNVLFAGELTNWRAQRLTLRP